MKQNRTGTNKNIDGLITGSEELDSCKLITQKAPLFNKPIRATLAGLLLVFPVLDLPLQITLQLDGGNMRQETSAHFLKYTPS